MDYIIIVITPLVRNTIYNRTSKRVLDIFKHIQIIYMFEIIIRDAFSFLRNKVPKKVFPCI